MEQNEETRGSKVLELRRELSRCVGEIKALSKERDELLLPLVGAVEDVIAQTEVGTLRYATYERLKQCRDRWREEHGGRGQVV